MNADLPPLHIFRPGRHTAMSGATLEFTAEMLAATAAAYDPAKFEAPIVVGHPATDAPAYGWVARLIAREDGLFAEPVQVDPAFAEMVKAGRFKKISASFFTPDAPSNPVPGVYYLRHVGFLGAAAPAVKGLRQPTFAEGDAGVETLEFSTREETATVTPIDPAALEAENAQLKQQLAEFAARERAAAERQRHAEHAAFCDKLVADGRLAPGMAPVIVATLDYLAAQEQVVEFAAADGASKPLGEAIKEALQQAPKLIDFAERGSEQGENEKTASFAMPSGMEADAAALELHRKALAYAQAHKIDYLAAVAAIQKGD